MIQRHWKTTMRKYVSMDQNQTAQVTYLVTIPNNKFNNTVHRRVPVPWGQLNIIVKVTPNPLPLSFFLCANLGRSYSGTRRKAWKNSPGAKKITFKYLPELTFPGFGRVSLVAFFLLSLMDPTPPNWHCIFKIVFHPTIGTSYCRPFVNCRRRIVGH